MKLLFASMLAVLLLGCTAPQTAPLSDAPPPWQYLGRTSYEERAPGYGVSHKYASAAGNIDVYVYDLQRGEWQAGVSDPAFAREFLNTIEEVKHYARKGAYSELQIGPVQDRVIAGHNFRSVSYRFLRQGRRMESLTFLTARGGKLLKYRMSFFTPATFDIPAHADKFIEESSRELENSHRT